MPGRRKFQNMGILRQNKDRDYITVLEREIRTAMIAPTHYEMFVEVLQSAPQPGVRSITAKNVDLDQERISTVADLLSMPSAKWKFINLENKHVQAEGAKTLAKMLHINVALVSINLNGCAIQDEGATAIAEALKSNETLVILRLQENEIKSTGALAIADSLKENNTLAILDLQNNEIDDIGAQALVHALNGDDDIGNTAMAALALDLNPITIGLEDLEQILKRNRELHMSYQLGEKMLFMDTIENSESKGPWNRAKLMIVGQGKAGKSATVRSLLGESFNEKWDSTIGVNLTQVRSRNNNKGSNSQWDKEDNSVSFASKLAADITVSNIRPEGEVLPGKNLGSRFKQKVQQIRDLESNYQAWKQKKKKKKRVRFDDAPVRVIEDNIPPADPVPEVKKKSGIQEYDSKLLFDVIRNRNALEFTIWDYGGQNIFYTLHHLFLTSYGVYLLVFDMSQVVRYNEIRNVTNTLKFWLNSIQIHAPGAPVLIVGTRLDTIESETQFRDLDELMIPLVERGNFEDVVKNINGRYYFPLDNTTREGISDIQETIERVTREQSFVKQLVKLSWLQCLDTMLESVNPWLSLPDVVSIGEKIAGITSSVEIDDMLALFHELGMVLHFTGTDALNQIVIIQPQWLIDKIGCVIKDPDIHDFPSSVQESGLTEELNTFLESGIISKDLVQHLWRGEQVDFLVDLMRRTLILSDWKFSKEPMFLIPSMIIEESRHDLDALESGKAICLFDFSDGFLPLGVFERLVCLLVQHSSSNDGSKQPQLGRNFSHIYLNKRNGVELLIVQDPVDQVVKLLVSEPEDASLCFNIVIAIIRKINSEAMHNRLNYQLKFSSLESPKIFLDSDQAQLSGLKPWFGAHSGKDSIHNENHIDAETANLNAFMEYLDDL